MRSCLPSAQGFALQTIQAKQPLLLPLLVLSLRLCQSPYRCPPFYQPCGGSSSTCILSSRQASLLPGPPGTSGARHIPFDVESNSLRKFCFLERSFLPASREAQTPPQRFGSNPELGSEQETLAFSEMLGTLENITFLAETHF